MQTILGSGGAIGVHLARSLAGYTPHIRLASRNPSKVNDSDEIMAGDLLEPANVERAVEGSEVVYVTVGFPYSYKFWKAHWPAFINHVIGACEKHGARLVFFDNVYMYDPSNLAGMTEETPIGPVSRKGEIRRVVASNIMNAVEKGTLKALIARSADFYGPGFRQTSMISRMVFDPLSKGKKANWLISDKFRHSCTYTPDAGRATALLGNNEDAFNQVWHLPTAVDPPTGEEWIRMIAGAFGTKDHFRILSRGMVKTMGVLSPVMREFPEMMYQYDRDYVFHSDKFKKRFKLEPTPYKEAIRSIIEADYRTNQS